MKRIVVVDADVIRRALFQCAMPPGSEVTFAVHVDEVDEADVAFVGPTPGRSVEEVCNALRGRMSVILFDERYVDEEVAREEASTYQAAGYVAPPLDRKGIQAALTHMGTPQSKTMAGRRRAITDSMKLEPEGEVADPSSERLWEAFRTRVDTLYRNLERLDHYQILELPKQSSPPQIRQAYQIRSLEFHPDRLAAHPNDELRGKLYEITKAVNEAFRVLGEPATRAKYDEDRRPRERPGSPRVRIRPDRG